MVSLKSWVRGIIETPVSSIVCTRPSIARRRDGLLLPFLRTAANQNYQAVAILAEVDAVAGTEVDLVFKHAGTNALDLREIPLLQTRKRNSHLGGGRRIDPDRK